MTYPKSPCGSLERPGDGSTTSDASALQATPGGPPSSGHSSDSLFFWRSNAESFGDLAAEMVAEGLEGIAYGAARKAAHYAALVARTYEERRS